MLAKTKFDPPPIYILMCLLIPFVYLLVACVPAEIEPGISGPPPTQDTTMDGSPTPPPVPVYTRQPVDPGDVETTASTLPPNPSPTWTPWDVPSPPRPTFTPVPVFPGLIYVDEAGIWQVTGNWQPILLADINPGAMLSHDGRQAIYLDEGDIWSVNLATRSVRNLTQDSGRVHCCLSWWPERPETIVFGSWPIGSDLGPSTGYLSTVMASGRGYTVLDEESMSNAMPALSPDGKTIAYDRAGTAWLYHWDTGSEPLNLAEWGLENIQRIGGPAWSPDGSQLAWTAAIRNPDWRIALVILDMERQSALILHPYENVGRGGWFPPPSWSPDGRWLAFTAEDVDPGARGVWVIASDGSSSRYLGPGSQPLWSPDGRWLTYTGFEEGDSSQNPVTWLVEAESWYAIRMQLPAGARVVDWTR